MTFLTRVLYILTLSAISVQDIRKREIPVFLSLVLLFLNLFTLNYNTISMIFPWFFYILTAAGAAIFDRTAPFGMGDALLLSCMGAGLAPRELGFIFCAASFSSGVFAAILLLTKRVRPEDDLPFAPFILLGYLLFLPLS